jgi:DNA-binding NarL/FixJ family response regulator
MRPFLSRHETTAQGVGRPASDNPRAFSNQCSWLENCGGMHRSANGARWLRVAERRQPGKERHIRRFVDAHGRSVSDRLTEITMAPAKQNQSKDSRKRILLVDDHAVVRYGIAQLINHETDLVVCGEQEDAAQALSEIGRLKPDLVIADISLKDSSGLELMRNIKAQHAGLPVLVVSAHDESVYAEIAFRAGALGYLMKGEALNKVVTAIRRVLSGNIYVSDTLAAKLLRQQVSGRPDIQEPVVRRLSNRELEVFQLIGQWKKTSEIARQLHLSIKTIEYYREQIKQKLDIPNAAELTHQATTWAQRELAG